MKTIKNDYCIRMFVGNDKFRPALSFVSSNDGYLYASDARIVAKIKEELCILKYKPIEGFPNCESVIKQHVSFEVKTISVEKLFNELMKIECCFKPKMIECDECNGEGTCTCYHCNSKYNCKECDGLGEKESQEMELSGEYDCMLFGRRFALKYLDLIIRTAVFTNVEEIKISNPEDSSGSILTVGDFEILLMPKYQ
jgi:hypothetical protein